MSETIDLALELMSLPSITPDDHGCQAVIAKRLSACGFDCETLPFGQVSNLWARLGTEGPLFVFAGHTDVVPPGDESAWRIPPFQPQVHNGLLVGRGAVDMKAAIAAMITAVERVTASGATFPGSIGFLITSDEEDGASGEGTSSVIRALTERGIQIDYCLVGEPTSQVGVGDMIKNGRRGSLSAKVTFHGVQGHIAYPELAKNPIPYALQACNALVKQTWDQGNDYFQPTQCQISNIHAGTGVTNVIPGAVVVDFNFRFSPEISAEEIKARVTNLFYQFDIEHRIDWHLSGEPYLTPEGELVTTVAGAIQSVTGHLPQLSTDGGTSDARFIAPTGAEVVECGLDNQTAHKVDECVRAEDVDILSEIYELILRRLR